MRNNRQMMSSWAWFVQIAVQRSVTDWEQGKSLPKDFVSCFED